MSLFSKDAEASCEFCSTFIPAVSNILFVVKPNFGPTVFTPWVIQGIPIEANTAGRKALNGVFLRKPLYGSAISRSSSTSAVIIFDLSINALREPIFSSIVSLFILIAIK